jgi:hypothetical protein
MSTAITQSMAHDPAIMTVCAESEELAELLAEKATMICCVECGDDIYN